MSAMYLALRPIIVELKLYTDKQLIVVIIIIIITTIIGG